MASQNSEEIYNGRMKFHNQEYHLFNLVHVGMLNSIVTCTGRFLWPVLQYSGHICSAPWNKCLRWFLLLSKQGSPINIQVVAEPNWNTTNLKREMWRTEKKCANINYYIRQLQSWNIRAIFALSHKINASQDCCFWANKGRPLIFKLRQSQIETLRTSI